MKMVTNILNKLKNEFKFYLRLFYDPSLYRDIAFRTSGYGLKRVFLTLFLLMIPSVILLYLDEMVKYQSGLVTPLANLPHLRLNQGQLFKENQSDSVLTQINPQAFEWVDQNKIKPEFFVQKQLKPFLLSKDYLWVNFTKQQYFGLNLNKNGNYFPMVLWRTFKDKVSGTDILKFFNQKSLFIYTLIFSLFMYMVNCFCIFFFIRTFGLIAKRMVLLVLKDSIPYDVACRLLSTSLIVTLIILDLIVSIAGFSSNIKFIFITIYMFNFYVALRCIKVKSQFRWLSGIK